MAQKRALPFILPARLDERARLKQLRRYKIKPSNIAKIYEADGWILYIPTKKSFFKLPKEMIPGRELEHRIKRIHDYIEEYRSLIDLERRAEMDAQRNEIRTLSGREREVYGRAILGLKGRGEGMKFDLFIVRFSRDKVIDTEIGSGDIVLISRGEPLKSDLTATVMSVAKNYIEAAFSQKPPAWVRSEGIRVDLYVNDITFKRMESNLEKMRHIKAPYSDVRDIVLGLKSASKSATTEIEAFNGDLNETQLEAVSSALGGSETVLIHGPPGTGKTTTVTEVIVQAVKRGQRVLASADSNVAVDNMLRKLSKVEGLNLVRIGHPARVGEGLERYALFTLMENDPANAEIRELVEEVREHIEARNVHSKPTPARLRGMSRERIRTLAASGRSYRGVDTATIRSMARWIAEDEKVQRLFERIRALEEATVRRIVTRADVVLSTNGMVGSEALEGIYFDLAVIDEASQQMEPSTLLPMLRAPRAVLAGDHRQLPPTVLSGLDILRDSLFERLMQAGGIVSTMLGVQYRMNGTIMDFPNTLMYDGLLEADPSVAGRILKLERVPSDPFQRSLIEPEKAVTFIDTPSVDADERLRPRSTSYENEFEAGLVTSAVKSLVECGVKEGDIGIITPYLSQVKLIREMLEREDLQCEVRSVDGFQGREKEVVIISFVRSNLAREIGFVKDSRRLNVAMTRAKSKLIMIGNRTTLEPNTPFDRLFEWLEKEVGASLLKAPAS
ncbi:DNA helicase, putative [Hydrogenimonas sp.]|nr:DNA helicase, putative [Hydrogenimonas sp.]